MSSGTKIIIAFTAITLIIVVAGISLLSKSGAAQLTSSQETVQLEIPQTSHDWGQIPINGGKVNHVFTLKNLGPGILELGNVSTSCMCTTAQLTINDNRSPFFGMHSQSSWLGQVPPGQTADISIEFDPAYHGPNALGPVTRQVSLETNDSSQPQISFNLSGNVIK